MLSKDRVFFFGALVGNGKHVVSSGATPVTLPMSSRSNLWDTMLYWDLPHLSK